MIIIFKIVLCFMYCHNLILIIQICYVQAAYTLFSDAGTLKLPYCIIISGFVCGLFAIGIPHLSALRIWLGVSTSFGLIYILIAIALSLKDGNAKFHFFSLPFFLWNSEHSCEQNYWNWSIGWKPIQHLCERLLNWYFGWKSVEHSCERLMELRWKSVEHLC